MPRVTQRDQYQRHQILRDIWLQTDGRSFVVLRPYEQQKIHAFYRPDEALSFKEYVAHLRQIKIEHPGIVQVAGKLSRTLLDQATYQAAAAALPKVALPTKGRRGGGVHYITVQAIVRPQPDFRKLVAAIREMARYEARRAASSKEDLDHSS